MRYIESYELREWVKDNLRKTIFQKAHALAIQTGCEILVKLHDSTDVSGCQYYATNNIKKHYRSSKLRRPGELMVSGETGLPLMDKCTQSGDSDNGDITTATEPSGHLSDGSYSEADRTMNEAADPFTSVDSHSQGSQFDPRLLQVDGEDIQYHTGSSDDNGQLKSESEHGDSFAIATSSDEIHIKEEPIDIDMQQPIDSNNSLLIPEQAAETSTGSTPSRVIIPGRSVQRYAIPISPKPYQCSICQKTFRSVQILQKHTLTFHSRPKSHHVPLTKIRGKVRVRGQHTVQYVNRQPSQEDLLPKEYHCVICNQSFGTTHLLQDHVTQAHMGTTNTNDHESSSSSIATTTLHQQHESSPSVPTSHMTMGTSHESATSHMTMDTTHESATSQQTNQATSYAGLLNPALMQTAPLATELLQTPPEQPQSHDGAHSSMLDVAGTSSSSLHHMYPSAPLDQTSQGNSPITFNLSNALTSSPRRKGHRTGKTRTLSRSYKFEDFEWKMKTVSNRNIMVALLMTAGPISSPSCINHAGPVFLRNIHKPQFIEAATNLQILGIGSLVKITSLSNGPHVFIKKAPSEVKEALEANRDILDCRFEYYEQRFNMPMPGYCVSSNIRTALIDLGYINA